MKKFLLFFLLLSFAFPHLSEARGGHGGNSKGHISSSKNYYFKSSLKSTSHKDSAKAKIVSPGRHKSNHAKDVSSGHSHSSKNYRIVGKVKNNSHKDSSRLKTVVPGQHESNYAAGVERDSHGRIKRSESAKLAFMKQTGYPNGRSGYVVDHIVPLNKGGADSPSNMQWQTKEDAKAKDKWE